MAPHDATLRQIAAANPANSTWLSANAGSGKTRVLTDRVARLLLGGVAPQNVLCLTYTKAAAAEMQIRLFQRLGDWAMRDDAKLRAELAELGVVEVDPAGLARARRLFASAIEAPGGLKIQTIHSFCGALLRQFPLEAGVSPYFTEIDDVTSKALQLEVVDEVASGDNAGLVAAVAGHVNEADLSKLTAEIVRHRAALSRPTDAATIWRALDLRPGYDLAALEAELFGGGEEALLRKLVPLLKSGSITDAKSAAHLANVDFAALSGADLDALCNAFLTQAGAVRKSFPTKAVREKLGADEQPMAELIERVEQAKEMSRRLTAARTTLALHDFARVFLKTYEARKAQRGMLDFDDLISRAHGLLSDPQLAEWVLYRLDGGIDHILVDEAQDTSPEQWQVIELLAREFTSGHGSRGGVERTIFIVGDYKQSIYSFQGADPESFNRMRDIFADRLKAIDLTLHQHALDYSFRSSPVILRAVDHTFALTEGHGVGGVPNHAAFHADAPGRVDVWPTIEADENAGDREWFDPVDMPTAGQPGVLLAEKLATEIARMIREEQIPDRDLGFRPITAGDFLVLVQSRGAKGLFPEIIRACKAHGIEVAGADRLTLMDELAVRDLMALLSFLATADDDLSLATVLRSPLFGLSEGAMYDLAHDRPGGGLWSAFYHRRADFPQAFAILDDLRGRADYLGPYALLERILTRHRGRDLLLGRLGQESEDGIDALLAQAVLYEYSRTFSLTGFLAWMETGEVVVKRKTEGSGQRLRVMTAHGAKGLEAPIVILPDSGVRSGTKTPALTVLEDGTVAVRSVTAEQPAAEVAAVTAEKARAEQENRRLLYVAMTRAKSWLIVCGAGKLGDPESSWHGIASAGVAACDAAPFETPAGMGLRLQGGDWAAGASDVSPLPRPTVPPLPSWITEQAATPPDAIATLSPSDLGGDKTVSGETEMTNGDSALVRGTFLHRLLEILPTLPQEDRFDRGASITMSDPAFAALPGHLQIVEEALAVLSKPDLQFLFAPSALAEQALTAILPELNGRRISGAIDCLVVEPDRILAVDFKSNLMIPQTAADVPEGYLRQMGAYQAALAQIYPDRRVETAILWTRAAQLMYLPHETVNGALRRAATP